MYSIHLLCAGFVVSTMAIIQSIDVSTAIQFVAWFDIRPYPQLGTAVPTSLHTSLGLTNNEAEDWGGGIKT